jgi:hypothetical protein
MNGPGGGGVGGRRRVFIPYRPASVSVSRIAL